MSDFKCPICGEEKNSKAGLASHMWSRHKVKYSDYFTTSRSSINESKTQKFSEGLISTNNNINESRELINQQTAMVVDKSLMEKKETPDRDFVSKTYNPYKDLYSDSGSEVLNEWLS